MRSSVDLDRKALSASSHVATMLGGGATGASISSFWTSGGGTVGGVAGAGGTTGAAGVGWADEGLGPATDSGWPEGRRVDGAWAHRCKMEGHPARE